MIELKHITENILEISECLVTTIERQTDVLFYSVMNQVSVSQRDVGYLCVYICEKKRCTALMAELKFSKQKVILWYMDALILWYAFAGNKF